MDVRDINVDTIAFSGHKIHGPRGIGGLFISRATRIEPVFLGGNQEMGLRSGTEDLPAIAGLDFAVDIRKNIMTHEFERIAYLKDKMEKMIQNGIDDIRINSGYESSPYILNLSIRGVRGEVLVHFLERDRIYISTGSACSSKKTTRQYYQPCLG
jgi:cysteine desulfurase